MLLYRYKLEVYTQFLARDTIQVHGKHATPVLKQQPSKGCVPQNSRIARDSL